MASTTRVTQQAIEVLRQTSTPESVVTQQAIEVLRQVDTPFLRVTQVNVEVMRAINSGNRAARISQLYTDTIRIQPPTAAWITQIFTETIRTNPLTAKPGLKSWMVFDRDAFFDVTMIAGTPSTAADVYAVLNGANLIAMGNELLQFQTATDQGGNIYRLSNLLRGRLGTEQFMNSHSSGELVYFLSTSTIRRVLSASTDLNMIKYWKIIGIGQLLDSKAPITKINTGLSLKPWAPVHITGTRDGSSNLTVTWTSRSRIGHQRLLEVSPPVGEVEERYKVEFLNTIGTVVRTFTPTTPSQVYTAAEQTTDFGSTQAAIPVRISKTSGSVGDGYSNTEIV